MTTRVMPPGDGLHPTIKVNGRTYTAAVGSTIDVPDHDALVMVSNGWLAVAGAAAVGTTAQRPTAPVHNQQFVDTTVGMVVLYDAYGKRWVNHITGAAA